MSDFCCRKVVTFNGGKRVTDRCQELNEEIKAAIYKHAGHMPVAAAIGVLRIVEREILDEAVDE